MNYYFFSGGYVEQYNVMAENEQEAIEYVKKYIINNEKELIKYYEKLIQNPKEGKMSKEFYNKSICRNIPILQLTRRIFF